MGHMHDLDHPQLQESRVEKINLLEPILGGSRTLQLVNILVAIRIYIQRLSRGLDFFFFAFGQNPHIIEGAVFGHIYDH